MSIKFTFATSHEKNFASYVETVDSRRIALQFCTDLPQKSRSYNVANSRYHFRRREFDKTIYIRIVVDFKEIMASLNFRGKTRVRWTTFHEFSEIIIAFLYKLSLFLQNFHSQSQNRPYALTKFPLRRLTNDCPRRALRAGFYRLMVARGKRRRRRRKEEGYREEGRAGKEEGRAGGKGVSRFARIWGRILNAHNSETNRALPQIQLWDLQHFSCAQPFARLFIAD